MARFVLAPAAAADIEAILAWTHEQFGETARLKYEALLVQAMIEVSQRPNRTGCTPRDEIAPGAFTYHLWHSRNRVSRTRGRVRRPRHFLVFRRRQDGTVEIGRVLHDSMDLSTHGPNEGPDPPPTRSPPI